METKQLRPAAACAKAIRQDLKLAFKGVKFSVVSQSYTGGGNVNVNWIDGPSTDAVREVIGKYKEGHFDGMVDSYCYDNRRTDIPQIEYLFYNRKMSNAVKEQILSSNAIGNDLDSYEVHERLHRVFNEANY